MNVTSRVSDVITRHTVNLMRLSESIRKDVIRQLERLEADLVHDLLVGGGKSELTLKRMQALLAQTRATIDTAYGAIAANFTPQLKAVAIEIAKKTAAAVNAAVRVELMTVGLTQTQIEYIAGKTVIEGLVQAKWWSTQSTTLRNKFAAEMRQGQYRGEGVDQLVRRIRGTKANGFTDGVMNVPKHQAEALVRTGVMSVANEAKLASYLNNRDVIRAIQWHATLEGACPECAELNGKIWTLPESGDKDANYKPEGHAIAFPGAIAHFNCRCAPVPITYSYAELAARE